MACKPPENNSLFTIFLDIDGVLYNTPDQKAVIKKAAELFPLNDRRYNTSKELDIASAYFFGKEALKNLDHVTETIEKTTKVFIVVSSNWRKNRSVEALRTELFGMHNFAKYIVDKTPETIDSAEVASYCRSAKHSNGDSSRCRAAEIQHWLKRHPEVTSFAVLDDDECMHLSENFGQNFIQTNYRALLTAENSEKILSLYERDRSLSYS